MEQLHRTTELASKNESATFDADFEISRISNFLKSNLEAAKAQGYVIGVSGGIDSAVVAALCTRAIGAEGVFGVLLFEEYHKDSVDYSDANALIEKLQIKSVDIPVSPLVAAYEQILQSKNVEASRVTMANLKARIRMTVLYALANQKNYLVAGTGDKSEDLLGYFCYDEKTSVVTTKGLKGYEELKKGDTVYSYDLGNAQVVESNVENVHVFDYSGDMINFKSKNADLMVTPNHRMLVRTSCGNLDYNKVRIRTAEECLTRKYTVIPVPKGWAGKPCLPTHIEIEFSQKHVQRNVSLPLEDAFYLIGLFIGDGCAVKGQLTVPLASSLSRQEYIAISHDRLGRFATLSASNTIPRMKTYDIYETDFALPIPDKNAARARLIQILKNYGIGFSLTHNLVRVPSKGIYNFFSQCGFGALNKRIPGWILDYPSHYLSFLLKGLKDSDGGHSDLYEIFYTSSKKLKDDFVVLCAKLGRLPTVRMRSPRVTHYKGKEIRTSEAYEITYAQDSRNSCWITNSRVEKIPYQGKVWCPSVPPHENILVQRNGRYAFCGNTKYGDGGVDLLPIAHLYKGQVRALGRRLGLPERMVTKPSSPNLWKGHKATDELPADYETLDPIMSLMFDQGNGPLEVSKQTGAPLPLIDEVLHRNLTSRHKRSYPPMVTSW